MALSNEVTLGLHLGAGASDGYLVSAENVQDATKSQTVQKTLDDIYSKSEVDAKVAASGTFDSSQYYTKTETDAKFGDITIDGSVIEADNNIMVAANGNGSTLTLGGEQVVITADALTLNMGATIAFTKNMVSALAEIADKIADGYSVVFVKNS